MDYTELASVMGDWEMDDDIRGIIYGGSTGASSVGFLMDDVDMSVSGGLVYPSASGGDVRRGAPSEGRSDYYDAIMDNDLRYTEREELGHGDYRNSVDAE